MKRVKALVMACVLAVGMTAAAQNAELAGHSTVAVNGGVGFITSKFEGYWDEGNPKVGSDWSGSYSWTSAKGFGAGILYAYYHSSCSYMGLKYNADIHYVAPQFVWRFYRKGNWLWEMNAGVGYFRFNEKMKSVIAGHTGFGINFLFNGEYLFNPHFGLGVSTGYIYGFLSGDNAPVDDAAYSSVARFSIEVGLRAHF